MALSACVIQAGYMQQALTVPRQSPPLLGGPRHVTKVAVKTQVIALAWEQD